MPRVVVSAGKDYLDIDAAGGIVAYASLLQAQGFHAIAASTAPFNASIPASLTPFTVDIRRDYSQKPDDEYVVIDLSDRRYFDGIIDPERVVNIFDHHVGFEAEWKSKLGGASYIEFVGAACTLVYEQWHTSGLEEDMSREVAIVLAAGIIDNTLNLKATLTTERDIQAYAWLKRHAQLHDSWPEEYLAECQSTLMDNFVESLANDTKIILYPGLDYDITIGQVMVLDADELLRLKKTEIATQLSSDTDDWYMNILDLSKGSSYFFTTNQKIQSWLTQKLQVTFDQDIAVADRLWLRKEIYKKATEI